MAGPQRSARGALGGGCGVRQVRRPAAPAHGEDAAGELLVYATIGLCKIWPGVRG